MTNLTGITTTGIDVPLGVTNGLLPTMVPVREELSLVAVMVELKTGIVVPEADWNIAST